ncbi:MAG: glycosyltransferase [Anaerovoracaceae bacterium]
MKFAEKRADEAICYAGSLTEDRGITQLVKASYIAGCTLKLAGNFHSDEYKNFIFSLSEAENTEYLGELTRTEILDLYSECAVGMATILDRGQYFIDDNLPTKVYEYMAVGLPSVISDTKHAREVNAKYNCFELVDPENTEEIAAAIKSIVDNPQRQFQMSENGRNAIKNELNWDIEAEKLIKLYSEITDEKEQ